MVTDKTSKISKAVAIQLMDEQINQFSLLRPTDADLEENFLSAFGKTVSIIHKFLSIDDAIIFIKIVVSNFDFESSNLENFWYSNIDEKVKAAYVNTLHEKIKYEFIGTSDEYKIEHIFEKSSGISLSSWDKITLFIEKAEDFGVGGPANYILYKVAGKIWGGPPAYKLVKTLILKTAADCLEQLILYKMKIMQTWDDTSASEYAFQIQKGEFVMRGDSYNISGNKNSTFGNIAQGENIQMISDLRNTGQTDLAQALKALTDAVIASHDLPADQKEEQVEAINQIGKEAAKPKPNKIVLKGTIDGVLAALKAVPDVASAVSAVMPLLSQLHL